MQREITHPTKLLTAEGALACPGYARHMLYQYDRRDVKAGPFSLKEWDFYQLQSGSWVLQLTIGHVSYAGSFSANLFNIETGERKSLTRMRALPLDSLRMPANPEMPHVVKAVGAGYIFRFAVRQNTRRLYLKATDKQLGHCLVDITLHNDPQNEKMVIATPFAAPGQFYLNYKENYYGMRGSAMLGGTTVTFGKTDTALLDWGRGVWPFRHEWFWGNGSGFIGGKRFGFNIGWGFGDTRHATENMFFYEGTAYKLGTLQVERDPKDYTAPWRFTSDDGSFDLTLTPQYDNYTETRLAFVDNRCHQVFGRFNGKVILPDGTQIDVRDFPAFCEHAQNQW